MMILKNNITRRKTRSHPFRYIPVGRKPPWIIGNQWTSHRQTERETEREGERRPVSKPVPDRMTKTRTRNDTSLYDEIAGTRYDILTIDAIVRDSASSGITRYSYIMVSEPNDRRTQEISYENYKLNVSWLLTTILRTRFKWYTGLP